MSKLWFPPVRRALVAGCLAILAVGSVAHFVHGWTGRTWVTALVFPIDESVWEHTRLATWPGLAVLVIQGRYLRGTLVRPGLAFAAYVLTAPTLIALLYYGYTGAFGVHALAWDLTVFVIAVVTGQAVALSVGTRGVRTRRGEVLGWVITALVALGSIAWTFWAPDLPMFREGN